MYIEFKLSESNTPNPSSIAKKFGLGKFDTLINEVLIANDEINFTSKVLEELNSKSDDFNFNKIYSETLENLGQ